MTMEIVDLSVSKVMTWDFSVIIDGNADEEFSYRRELNKDYPLSPSWYKYETYGNGVYEYIGGAKTRPDLEKFFMEEIYDPDY